MEKLNDILHKMGFAKPTSISAFRHEDGEGEYDVWRIEYPDSRYVLKRATAKETENYVRYLNNAVFAPRLIAQLDEYLLLAYIEGENLMRFSREYVEPAVQTLCDMQQTGWNAPQSHDALQGRINRRKYLNSELLERAYDAYLQNCMEIPWTLCHDDLLPFNVIGDNNKLFIIDWEHAGILPYPASLARLIAHSEDRADALFYMSEDDKTILIDLYYHKLLEPKGISYDSFRRSLALHLFYEYCEWVYVGNKCADTSGELFRKYRELATIAAKKLGF